MRIKEQSMGNQEQHGRTHDARLLLPLPVIMSACVCVCVCRCGYARQRQEQKHSAERGEDMKAEDGTGLQAKRRSSTGNRIKGRKAVTERRESAIKKKEPKLKRGERISQSYTHEAPEKKKAKQSSDRK